MRPLDYTLLVAGALALAAPVASAQNAFEIEGKVYSVTSDGLGGAVMRVMGTDVVIPPGTPIASPTASLTVQQLLDPRPLPGRSEQGFVGGTAIVSGTTGPAGAVAADVFVEPAENVVVGRVTGPLQVEGMTLRLLDDERMPAQPIMNAFGFEVNPATIAIGTPAAIEGYYVSPYFHAFLIEAEGGTIRNVGVREVSILRAQCRQRTNGVIELEVRGATHDPATGTVSFRNVANTRTYGTATVTADAGDPQFGAYRFRVQSAALGPCVPEIVAVFGTATAVGTVAVRVD